MQPGSQLAILRPGVRDIAVPVLAVKRFQLGHHGIPIPGNEPPRPHGPRETDRVQPLDPLRIETPLLPLTAAVEDPGGQRRIFLVGRGHVAMTVPGLEGRQGSKSLLPPVRPLRNSLRRRVPPRTKASSPINRFWFEQGPHQVMRRFPRESNCARSPADHAYIAGGSTSALPAFRHHNRFMAQVKFLLTYLGKLFSAWIGAAGRSRASCVTFWHAWDPKSTGRDQEPWFGSCLSMELKYLYYNGLRKCFAENRRP